MYLPEPELQFCPTAIKNASARHTGWQVASLWGTWALLFILRRSLIHHLAAHIYYHQLSRRRFLWSTICPIIFKHSHKRSRGSTQGAVPRCGTRGTASRTFHTREIPEFHNQTSHSGERCHDHLSHQNSPFSWSFRSESQRNPQFNMLAPFINALHQLLASWSVFWVIKNLGLGTNYDDNNKRRVGLAYVLLLDREGEVRMNIRCTCVSQRLQDLGQEFRSSGSIPSRKLASQPFSTCNNNASILVHWAILVSVQLKPIKQHKKKGFFILFCCTYRNRGLFCWELFTIKSIPFWNSPQEYISI